MALNVANITQLAQQGVYFYMFTTTPGVTYLVSGSPATTHSFTVGLKLWGHTLAQFEIGPLPFELFAISSPTRLQPYLRLPCVV